MKNRTKEKITKIRKEAFRKRIEENEGSGETRTCNLQISRR